MLKIFTRGPGFTLTIAVAILIFIVAAGLIFHAVTLSHKPVGASGSMDSLHEREAAVFKLWQKSRSDYCNDIMILLREVGDRKDPVLFKECLKLGKDLLGRNDESFTDVENWRYLLMSQEECIGRLIYFAEMSHASVSDKIETARLIAGFLKKVRSEIIPDYEEKPTSMNVLPEGIDLNKMSDSKLKGSYLEEVKRNDENRKSNERQYNLDHCLWLLKSKFPAFCARVAKENPETSQTMAEILSDAGFKGAGF